MSCFRLAGRATALVAALAVLQLLSAAPSHADDTERLLKQIQEANLVLESAFAVRPVTLAAGSARMRLKSGVLVPISKVGGRYREFVFLGEGRFTFEPPDKVERQQLELFTSNETLATDFKTAVLVLGLDAAVDHLLSKGTPQALDPEQVEEAEDLFERWKESGGRRHVAIELALLRLGWQDPLYQAFFAGWLHTDKLGDFYYVVEPDSQEPVMLGRFEPIDATGRDLKRIGKSISRQQKQGRLIGLEIAHLGRWDTWVSTTLSGDRISATAGVSIVHNQLDITLMPRDERLQGKAVLTAGAAAQPASVLRLELNRNLLVTATSAAGMPAPFHQQDEQLLIQLPEVLQPGETIEVEIEYAGTLFDASSGAFILLDTIRWFPQTAHLSPATFDVIFHWPKGFDLVASGARKERGVDGSVQWERRTLDEPAWIFGFEIGRFEFDRGRSGDVSLILAVDPNAEDRLGDNRAEILSTAAEVLEYFQEIFGPYPYRELTLVTALRGFSQSLPGLVTLSSFAVEDDYYSEYFRSLDFRVLVAHEIAHQWWGHQVAWASYRDQWISEGMAHYAAGLFARHKLGESELRPTGDWKNSLDALTESGRRIGAVGPVVLGTRLASSRGSSAYGRIVYNKGAVVFDMLARSFGEENFLKVLRSVVEAVKGIPISTEDFLQLIERATGANLDLFIEQYVYGTGMPTVFYKYEVEQADNGKWKLQGSAEQIPEYSYRYRLKTVAGGGWDVVRKAERLEGDGIFSLVVPVQIAVFDPAFEEAALKGKKRRQETDVQSRGNRILQFHIRLSDESTPLAAELELEPKQFWLDAGEWVLGRFYNEAFEPKAVLHHRANIEADVGEAQRALDLYDQALRAEYQIGHSLERTRGKIDTKGRGRALDATLQMDRARLLMNLGRIEEAREALAQAAKLRGGSSRLRRSDRLQKLRLNLLSGKHSRAYKDLKSGVLHGWRILGNTEGHCLLAIAALATGNLEVLEEALAELDSRGVDTLAMRTATGL